MQVWQRLLWAKPALLRLLTKRVQRQPLASASRAACCGHPALPVIL